jgi:DNA repair exonuclease SbcCD ATPase subunit
MDLEFTEYERLMRELSDFIQESASHWASCDRLKLQLDHAQSQLAELRAKFETFKHPIQFSKQLEKIERDLNEIENLLDDLTSIRADNCEYCLHHARQLLKQLNDQTVELVSLESSKDGLVQAGIFNEHQATETTQRLENAQERCGLLSGRVRFILLLVKSILTFRPNK